MTLWAWFSLFCMASPPPERTTQTDIRFSSPAFHLEHSSEQWPMESSLDSYLQKHRRFPTSCPCWFSILSFLLYPRSYENHGTSGSFQENLVPVTACIMEIAPPFWAGLVWVRLPLRGLLCRHRLSSLPPAQKFGGTAFGQLCHKKFAKLLALPYHYF